MEKMIEASAMSEETSGSAAGLCLCSCGIASDTDNNKENERTQIMKSNTAEEDGKTNPVSEATDTMLKNYEQAVRTGLKLQEEAGRWWTSLLNQTASAPDLQKRVNNMTSLASSLLPLAQKRTEEVMALAEKDSRTGAELLKKAIDAAQTPVIADSQAKWMELLNSSVGAARAHTEALTQIGNKAIDSWIDFTQKNTEVTEIRVPKAA